MKKSLVALAALAVAGAASAQSSVTLFGVVDAAFSGFSNKTETAAGKSITTSQTIMRNSGYNASRLGFRGQEDLGGGLAAGFWLEAALGNDDGTFGAGLNGAPASSQLFNRRSTLSLSGVFGELRMGRDYVPTFWNDIVFDPFGINGVGTNLILSASGFNSQGAVTNGFSANPTQIRASNSVGYLLPPNLGGFYGQVMYAFNEQTSYDPGSFTPPTAAAIAANPSLATTGNNARVGRNVSGRFGYANGPLDVAASYGASTIASNYFLGTTTNLDTWNLGASYDFGVVKVFSEYSNNKLKIENSNPLANPLGFREPGANGWLLGATVPVGPGLIRFAYSAVKYNNITRLNQVFGVADAPEADKWALGYVHNLSKRTALYATVARVNNKNGADLTVGGPNYFTANAVTGALTPKSSTGYDLGIRHAF
ncbi:porin [Variovorax sp. Sphag1AA]|uniref:porin n=1 Tax=Variovorax sp. Sphag1AA TaxID=2587027 RepID=UPI00161FF91E|nr:porin [Variovorax sp. Sphag1AA]MBB3181928.1 putative porin [Variovorax sp. Sphag1AA]